MAKCSRRHTVRRGLGLDQVDDVHVNPAEAPREPPAPPRPARVVFGRRVTDPGYVGVTMAEEQGSMGLSDLVYRLYESRIQRRLDRRRLPAHVAVLMDGNRRWARAFGAPTSSGHQAGAEKAQEFLGWCEELDVRVVTLWMLSTDNLNRPEDELVPLLGIIEGLINDIAETGRWRVHPMGALDLLPDRTATVLKEAADRTRDLTGMHVNVAVGYGGRREIADAVRALLNEHAAKGASLEQVAEIITVERIAAHLYTKGQPDPDLVIRASGEQRLSGFMLWQSANSEFYFCEALWPDFRRVDFLRAMRSYTERERRFGH